MEKTLEHINFPPACFLCLPQPHRSPKINFPVDKRNPPPSDLSLHLFVLLVLHSLENTCITPSSHSRTKTASEPNDEEFPRNTEKKIHTESILVPLFILCVYFYTTFPGLVKQPNGGLEGRRRHLYVDTIFLPDDFPRGGAAQNKHPNR